jgi:cleavage and polyadenylation specificity factor subunit 3
MNPPEENDLLMIRPLGAGQEVGRSCIMLEFKGKKIMVSLVFPLIKFHQNNCYFYLEQLDCGIHPGLAGMDALPFVDLIEADEVDLLFISQ